MAPELIVKNILKYNLVKVQQIASDVDGFEVAGLIDRRSQRIEIAQRQKFETRRFTLAHEIAHAVLHRGEVLLHRDRPSDGTGRLDYQKPQIEQEADVFAAELLMPIERVTEAFISRFCGRIDRNDVDQNFAYNLNLATDESLNARQISRLSPYDLALRFACISNFGPDFFEPLDKCFGVSRSAMAYRLVEYGFVV